MTIKKEYLVAARDQFAQAQRSLVMAAQALRESGLPCEATLKEVKETIGDIAIAQESINDHLG